MPTHSCEWEKVTQSEEKKRIESTNRTIIQKSRPDRMCALPVIKGEEHSDEAIRIHHTDFPRICLKRFGIAKIRNALKMTIYGENVKPVTKIYKLRWDGKNMTKFECTKRRRRKCKKSA